MRVVEIVIHEVSMENRAVGEEQTSKTQTRKNTMKEPYDTIILLKDLLTFFRYINKKVKVKPLILL